MLVFAENFRGFKNIEIDTESIVFLVGDNSSGKSSILYLIHSIFENDLMDAPKLDEDFGVDRYDYFSPYFDSKPVTFGFMRLGDVKNQICKIITVKKTAEIPKVVRCSYWVPGIFLTIKKVGSSIYIRHIVDAKSLTPKEALNEHHRRGEFTKIQQVDVDSISDIPAIFAVIDTKDDKYKPLVKSVLSLNEKRCKLVSPIRALPERFYSFRRRIDAHGSHFAPMWIDIRDAGQHVLDLIGKFGRESNLFDKFEVKKISTEMEKPPLLVTVEKNGKSFAIHQVGIGASQIVPILIDSVFSLHFEKNKILVMQPELHLHPVAQAAFGSFLFSMAQMGLKGVFETHSSFLLDRFRSDLRHANSENANIKNVKSEIIFCVNHANGNRAIHMPINNDGTLGKEPDQYHRFFVDELLRTMF